MTDMFSGLLMVTGSIFMLLASVGLLRMPDIFMRMQSATKAYTLGPLLILGGAALRFGTLDVVARVLIVILFLFVTAPVAGHLVGRAAYRRGLPQWPGTIRDEFRELNGSRSGRGQSHPPHSLPASRSYASASAGTDRSESRPSGDAPCVDSDPYGDRDSDPKKNSDPYGDRDRVQEE